MGYLKHMHDKYINYIKLNTIKMGYNYIPQKMCLPWGIMNFPYKHCIELKLPLSYWSRYIIYNDVIP